MMNSPLISVIMPVFNAERFLTEAIDGILNQTISDFELIVVDDGSTDGTVEILRRHQDPRIRYYRNETNQGPAAARNRAIDLCRGRYVAFTDADDLAHRERFAKQVEYLQRCPQYRIVAAQMRMVDADRNVELGFGGYRGRPETIPSYLLFNNCFPSATMFMDRHVLEKERFNTEIPLASDYEMWVRLVKSFAASALPDTLMTYRVHNSNLTHRKQAFLERSLEQIARMQLGWLGIDPNSEELRHHLWLRNPTGGVCRRNLRLTEIWLKKLLTQNHKMKVYAPGPLREVATDFWMSLAERAAEPALWVIARCGTSSLLDRRRLRLKHLTRLFLRRAAHRMSVVIRRRPGG